MITGTLGDPWLGEALALLLDVVFLKGSLLIAIAWIGTRLLERSSAARRAAVWSAVIVGLLLLPVLHAAGPRWDAVPLLRIEAYEAPPTEAPSLQAAVSTVRPGRASAGRTVGSSATAPDVRVEMSPMGRWNLVSWAPWLVSVWGIGMSLSLGSLMLGWGWARRIRREGREPSRRLRERAARVGARLGLRERPDLLLTGRVQLPGVFGVLRPVVALPPGAEGWSEEELDAALSHEMTHVRRRDTWTLLAASVARAVYWMNPLAWWAVDRMAREREQACDDLAAPSPDAAIRYAEQLVRLARRSRRPSVSVATFLSMAGRRSSLRQRVGYLLDVDQIRAPATRRWWLGVGALTVAAAVPIAGIQVLAVGAQSSEPVAAHIDRLSDPDPQVRRRAAWALGEREAPTAIDPLVDALADADARVRVVAAWALGEIKNRRAVAALAALLRDPDGRVREMAVLALGEIEDPSALSTLHSADPSVASEEARAWAIAQIEGAGAYPEVFAGRLVEPEARRMDLLRYVSRLADPDPRSRTLAAEQLGRLGAPEAVDPLLDALEDRDPAVRAAVIWALDEINPTGERRSEG